MRILLFGLIFISPPFLKNLFLKWFYRAKIGHQAHIGWFSAVMGREIVLGDHSIIRPFTLIRLDGELRVGHYGEISSFTLIYGSSSLTVGDGSYIGPQCLINADEEIYLGQGSALGPRSMIFTHGSFLPYTEGYWVKLNGVRIGDKVWCAAGVFIHPGIEIGDDSFVNSRSVVTQSIPPGSIVEGNPAKVIYPMDRVKRKMSPRRVDAAVEQILRDFAEIGLRRELGIKNIEAAKSKLHFKWRGQEYYIWLIPSTGEWLHSVEPNSHDRHIFILNYPGWSPPARAMVFDLETMLTPFYPDPIHQSLRLFMQRYYGLKFAEQRQI